MIFLLSSLCDLGDCKMLSKLCFLCLYETGRCVVCLRFLLVTLLYLLITFLFIFFFLVLHLDIEAKRMKSDNDLLIVSMLYNQFVTFDNHILYYCNVFRWPC